MSTFEDDRSTTGRINARRRTLRFAVVGCVVLLALGYVGSRILEDSSTPSCEHASAPADGDTCESTWVWHYARGETPVGLPVYRQLLDAMPPGVHGCVVAHETDASTARRALCASVRTESEVDLVTVNEPLSEWARDRYIFYERDGKPHVLIAPRSIVHPHAYGDLQVPAAMRALHPDLVVRLADFKLEGGDVVVLGTRVLIGMTSVLRNTGPRGQGAPEFLARVAATFGRDVRVVGKTAHEMPYEHIDMFLTALDDDTIALGDPRLALDVFTDETRDRVSLGEFGVFDRGRQIAIAEAYDDIATELRGFGFEVLRLPVLHGEPGRGNVKGVVLTWNNTLLVNGADGRIAFVPRYGLAPIDQRAHDLWAAWGYEVVPVDARAIIAMGGSLRCVTNVLPGHGRAHVRRRSPL